jgi:hypothetical protein
MKTSIASRSKRKAASCPNLFEWHQNRKLLSNGTVRAIAGRARVTPATAALIAELAFTKPGGAE